MNDKSDTRFGHRKPVVRRGLLTSIVLITVVIAGFGCGHTPSNRAASPVASGAFSAGSNSQHPCALVRKSEATAIIGRSIDEPQQAPLGPTCIYRTPDSKLSIALGFQTMKFDEIRPLIRNLSPINGLGHQAYCGDYGMPTVFVLLSSDSLFIVSGPCAIARQFAAKAVPRL